MYDETKVEKTDAGYVITRNGASTTLDQPITYSSIRLFFHMPVGINEVFSETEGLFKNIIATGANSFQLTDKGNHVNNYTYDNGLLTEAVINHTLVDILLILRK